MSIQGLQDGVRLTSRTILPGETLLFHALPGPLLVRVLSLGNVIEERELVVTPGELVEVTLGEER